MAEPRRWYLVMYDIGDDKRWREVYRILRGWGERLQYSVFRVNVTDRDRERLRWELSKELDPTDRLLVVSVCDSCVESTNALNTRQQWPAPPQPVVIL